MNSWCPLPWMSVSIRNNGDARICCHANSSKNRGMIKKENGDTYNLSVDKIEDIRNSELLKSIRLDMLNGKYSDSCIRCQREDQAGMFSRKENEKRLWSSVITEEKAKDLTNVDGSIDLEKNKLILADIRFGNLCNLKCRMCGPSDSNQWYNDHVSIWNTDEYSDGDRTVKLVKLEGARYVPKNENFYNWFNNNFWKDLETYIPDVQKFYLAGGEPLLIDQHYDFLNKCVISGYSKNIMLEYNTNMTTIPSKALSLWKKFKEVRFGMSIDGVYKMNDYIRYPSKWSQIEKNIRLLDTAEGNFSVWWTATIQAYNIIHLPDLMLWKISQNFNRVNKNKLKPLITAHPLHVPEFLSIKIFPESSKKYILEYFSNRKKIDKDIIFSYDFLTNLEKTEIYAEYCKILDQYGRLMSSQDNSHLLEKFWKFTNTLDNDRDLKLLTVCPTTYDLLQEK